MSHEEWVLAPTNGRGFTGQKHRDTTTTQPGIFTVLLFFGDRKQQEGRGYGGVKVWRNSQLLFQGHDSIDHIPNASRELRKHDSGWGKIANLRNADFCVKIPSFLSFVSVKIPGFLSSASVKIPGFLSFASVKIPGFFVRYFALCTKLLSRTS